MRGIIFQFTFSAIILLSWQVLLYSRMCICQLTTDDISSLFVYKKTYITMTTKRKHVYVVAKFFSDQCKHVMTIVFLFSLVISNSFFRRTLVCVMISSFWKWGCDITYIKVFLSSNAVFKEYLVIVILISSWNCCENKEFMFIFKRIISSVEFPECYVLRWSR